MKRQGHIILAVILAPLGFFLAPFYSSAVSVSTSQNNRLNSGLVLMQSFNGGDVSFASNTAFDRSGLANNGVLTGFSTSTARVTGKIGQALRFGGGATNYVDVPTASNLNFGTGGISVSAWVKNSDVVNARFILGKRDPNGTQAGYELFINQTTGVLVFQAGTVGAYSYRVGTRNISDGKWHHVVGLRTGTTFHVYVDGQLDDSVDTTSSAGNVDNGSNLLIGRSEVQLTNTNFKGDIDEVRVYNRVLSTSEINTLYYAGLPTKTSTAQNTRSTGGLILMQSFNGQDVNFFSNTAFDSSGQGNNGILTNMSTSSSRVPGKIGQALRFNGVNSYIDMGNTGDRTGTAPYTLSVWVKLSTTPPSAYSIMNRGDAISPSNTKTEYLLYVDTDRSFHLQRHTASAASLDIGSSPQLLNRWYFVTATYDGNNAALYVDGVNVANGVDTTSITGTNKLAIGAADQGSSSRVYFFNGLIDEVRIYNQVLSATEVATLYKAGGPVKNNISQNTRNTGGLVLMQSFNGPDLSFISNTAFDRSGQGNNGILTNMSTSSSRVPGKIGQALRFDGVDDSISLSTAILAPDTGFTVNFWEKYRSSAPQLTLRLKGTSNEFLIYQDSIGTPIYAGFRSAGTNNMVQSSPTCTACAPSNNLGAWQMYTVTYNGGAKTSASSFGVYRNGVPIGLTSSTAGESGTNANVIGVDYDGTSRLNAVLDEVRVYDRVLSATEIQSLYRASR
jgi:hypothetical protein